MSRENSYSAIVIKKQAYGEADEIVTLYTREIGKLRVLCKSSKLPTSRLGSALQTFFLINIRLTKSSSLAKVIGVQVETAFPRLQGNPEAVALAFVAAEVIMRATPDEEKNEPLFGVFADLLKFLDEPHVPSVYQAGLVKFKIHALEALGLGISVPKDTSASGVAFSNSAGGFFVSEHSTSAAQALLAGYRALKMADYGQIHELSLNLPALDSLVSDFLLYQLEREIKSERFIRENDSVV